MTGHLDAGHRARISLGATAGLAAAEGLVLLDAAIGRDEPLLLAARLDIAGTRVQAARGDKIPALWQGLAGGSVRPAAVTVTGTTAGSVGHLAGDGSGLAGEARFWAAVEGGDVAALARTLALREDERLAELLPALASWRRQERDRSATEGWQYRISWVPVPGAEQGSPVLSGVWLVVVPSGMAAGLAGWAADALAGHGARPVLVELGAGELGVDELGRAAVAGRVGAVLEGREPSGVVSLLALAEDAGGVVPAGLAGTAGLVQGLADAGVGAPLWVLTCGAVAAVPGDVVGGGAQASVWGLGLTAALEFPERWGGLVDVPGVPDDRAGRRLCAVLAGCGEDQAAVRAGGVFGRRLVRAGGSAGGRAWVPRGTVLVTGGTGWAGGYVARWAAGRGASRVVLSSRSGPGAAGVAGLAAGLAGSGTAVEVVACDIADRDQAAGLVARAGATLSSILHAAGVAGAGTQYNS